MPAQLEIRSEEIQEIMGSVPKWLTRWGSTIVFATLMLLLIGAFFFPYPDVVNARVRLELKRPPELLKTGQSGTLTHLAVRAGELVRAGQPLFTYQLPDGSTRSVNAPRKGRVQWLRPLAVGDVAPAQEALIALHDTTRQYVATAEVNGDDMGSIRPGMPVTLQLSAYPAQKYGSLQGEVYAVSPLPVEGNYQVSIKLPTDLRFQHGGTALREAVLSGTAQIITQQRRLLTQLFSKS
ncbi:HlyD family efflux transporter periplasmic adaptor subunit [Rudanella paleaurantiibacter]|uniref:HlyD family efflux transporter periplasmic adaptor subunit n=1 Tax=Rudanella paleaurantiibacter TaxID=2614655 RepID=A0A7J5TVY5_9BACT|nr:HlyD family efflux transporter periplasmic adaptor subunit [Rudanella paleaurantiibacter]KAB7727292.1 HlyD family efflux transporter periplasmic adaptor subunit [Rudanella paleaurantiibacter]